MIQRIQSVYLILAVALMAAVSFIHPINFFNTGASYTLAFNGVVDMKTSTIVFSTMPLTLLTLLTAIIAFVSIFFYKKRMLQIRLNVFNSVLMVGYVPMMLYYVHSINKELGTTADFKILIVFPVIAAILTFLAIRAIGKDEALIRSLNRIR